MGTKLKTSFRVYIMFGLCLLCFLGGGLFERGIGFPSKTPAPTTDAPAAAPVVAPEPVEVSPSLPSPERPKKPEVESEPVDPTHPDWATIKPDKNGKLLTAVEAGPLKISVFDLGTVKALAHGYLVHPSTNVPIVMKGDKLKMIGYRFENTGEKVVKLPRALVTMEARYTKHKAWPWIDPMGGDYTERLYRKRGYSSNAVNGKSYGNEIFRLKPGQAYSYGDTYPLEKNAKVEFRVKFKDIKANKNYKKKFNLKKW